MECGATFSFHGEPGLPPIWRRFLASPPPLPAVRATAATPDELTGLISGLDLRELRDDLRQRLLRLWHDVLPWPMHEECGEPKIGCFADLIRALAGSPEFQSFWVGCQRGPFVLPALPFVEGMLTLEDVVHGLAVAACLGRRKPCETALTLTDGADFRCPLGLPPIRTVAELEEILEYGTVFLNTASLHWSSLAAICLAASEVLQFPTNINVYITGSGRKVSTDVHTDNHDVLILQCEGAKHWRVYPPPARDPRKAHPLYRGKQDDKLMEAELDSPLIDIVLKAGEVLFVPMGFPHFTSTLDVGGISAREQPSVHLTLGISTADYDLSIGGLRRALCAHLGESSSFDEAALSDEAFWDLFSPVFVGILVPEFVRWASDPADAYVKFMSERLLRILRMAEPERWAAHDEGMLTLVSQETCAKHLTKQFLYIESQEDAYREVVNAPDGVFLSVGAEESASEYRRVMLSHQAQEDARKRQRCTPHDERFVKRIDPSDGVARTKLEIRELYFKRGLGDDAVNQYWDGWCKPMYPNDTPPEDLLTELERASETSADLLHFLRRRTPHLHTRAKRPPDSADMETTFQIDANPCPEIGPRSVDARECLERWPIIGDWECVD